jgi:MFS family permease
MLQKIIHAILLRRHFWRHATFSEVAELYASRLLRMVAINLAASFMSIYLFQQGVSILIIVLAWAGFYVFKTIASLPIAAIVAWIGPKHAILASNILFIPAMVGFALLPEIGIGALAIVLLFQAVSSTLYSIGYEVDFSKVKSIEHAGKEIAYMNIVEKVATGLSPLVGGLLALFVGPQVVLVVAGLLFLVAAVPLFKTGEPLLPHQKLSFKEFPWRLVRGIAVAQAARGFDIFASSTMWSLYVAIIVIGVTASNDVYAIKGILLSVVLFAALGASYAYGKLIDKRRGKELLHIAIIADAFTHIIRPSVGMPISVAGLNVANEVATTGYVMAYTRGMFDSADLSGHRTTYLGVLEAIANAGAAIAALTAAVLVAFVGPETAFAYFFYVTAGVVLLILTARFPLYRK